MRRVPMPAVVTLLLLQAAGLVLFLGWSGWSGPEDTPPAEKKVHVLLLSSWRSGSSFLGQVFSQHPQVFYLMEPAWHVWTSLRRPGARGLRMAVRDLIRQVFQCDLSVMDAYLPPNYNTSHLFMWAQSRALCSPPACPLTPRDQFSEEAECKLHCNIMGLQWAEKACHSYSHVVLKEVRFFELESLYPLLKDPDMDLRIIHLVRDPRAVLRSREQSALALLRDSGLVLNHEGALPKDAQQMVMQEVCRSHVRIHETAMLKPPDFLRGRYRMIRYEDLVKDPLSEIQSMYDFVGLEMTDRLQEWIYRITHGKGKGSRKEAFKITSRNAEDVSLAWRSSLPYSKVKQIQDVCKGAMSLLGYRPVESEAELKLMNMELTSKRERYQFSWLPPKSAQSSNTD